MITKCRLRHPDSWLRQAPHSRVPASVRHMQELPGA
jgi:hypothetical protein